MPRFSLYPLVAYNQLLKLLYSDPLDLALPEICK
jgi:hypothetical protein